jgi:2-polyprenyl-6-methoxyphenol hydroxylase-like FAD-dependent oxidoreductase
MTSPTVNIPAKTTVLVVGGGPSGAYAASVLARRNIDVTILEAAKFPRYHIGESLLASTNYFLEYISKPWDRLSLLGSALKRNSGLAWVPPSVGPCQGFQAR